MSLKDFNVILVQNNPWINQWENNVKEIEKLLSQRKNTEEPLDILVFPECALTGYQFETVQQMQYNSEEQQKGRVYKYFSQLAQKNNCYIFAGYTEQNNNKYYNSMMIVNRQGKLIGNYRKRFMYTVDELFFQRGNEWLLIEIENLKGQKIKIFPIICMDINYPETIKAFIESQADVMIFSANWVYQEQSEKDVLMYWIYQLFQQISMPLLQNKQLYFLACGRVGKELVQYQGSSCFVNLSDIQNIMQTKQLSITETSIIEQKITFPQKDSKGAK